MSADTQVARWCVHIPGPDDLYPMRSRENADRLAAEHNETVVPGLVAKWRENPNYPRPEAITAVVIPWPHGEVADDQWERMCRDSEEAR